MLRIYCAGPLFNDPERREMERIAKVLEEANYTTFLPHRDGLEFAKLQPALVANGLGPEAAGKLLQRAIFALDISQLLQSDGVVVNLNGRVPDEGAVVEASLAWISGKVLVLYKADGRTLLEGADNPMVMGLGEFKTVKTYEDIPNALRDAAWQESRLTRIDQSRDRGAAIRDVLTRLKNEQGEDGWQTAMAEELLKLFTSPRRKG